MIVDIAGVLARIGMPSHATRVLVERPGHCVVQADTSAGPVVVKAATARGAIALDVENAIRPPKRGPSRTRGSRSR